MARPDADCAASIQSLARIFSLPSQANELPWHKVHNRTRRIAKRMLPIALSSGPLTEPAADAVRRQLGEQCLPISDYFCNGPGGLEMEADIRAGRIGAVLDLCLAEIAAELAGSPCGAGPDRLTAAAIAGIPQLIVLGELDAFSASPFSASSVDQSFTRTTPEQSDQLGREIAQKASAARGRTVILVPQLGLSSLDIAGGPHWSPQSNDTLIQSLTNWISPSVQVSQLNLHINEPAFAAAAVEMLMALMGHKC